MITYELVRIVLLFYGLCFADAIAKFKDNGYEDIVVTIGEEVKEDERIIDNIKKMFQDGSKVLHAATKQHTFFRQVNIVIPQTWSTKEEYEEATDGGRTIHSDIVVDKASPVHGENPYTLHQGECGEHGQYIHLTPDYLVHMNDKEKVDIFGKPGKVLVHEWAHLRWGVFDEYGGESIRYPSFYVGEDLQVHVTGCTAEIAGWFRTRDGGNCSADSFGKPDSKCAFFPAENLDIRGSLMNMHFLESVDSFCDDDEVPHNPWAPNRHNVMCERKSVWSVILEHPDFRNFNSTLVGSNQSQESTTFRLLQVSKNPLPPRFVLLLDLSSSMDVYFKDFWQSCYTFIHSFLPTEILFSVISFSSISNIDVDFTYTNKNNRMSIANMFPKDFYHVDLTAIGAALNFTLEKAQDKNISTRGLNIILITDGSETMFPRVDTVMPSIKEAGLIINTIAYGSHATDKLEDWAEDTGGRSYYHNADDSKSISRLYFLLYDLITQGSSENKFLKITSRNHDVDKNKKLVDKVDIDSKVGLETRFIFMEKIYLGPGNPFSLEVELRGPGPNLMFNSSSDGYYVNNDTHTIIISVPDAQAGVWTYTLRNTHKFRDNVYVDVLTKPRLSKDDPIRVKSWVSTHKLSFPAKMRVYAHVTRGYSPVLRADVIASVEQSIEYINKKYALTLKDDGVAGDVLKGDGIYTGVFTEFSSNGRYSVSVSVATTYSSIVIGRSDTHTTPRVPSTSNKHTTPQVPTASNKHTTPRVPSASNTHTTPQVPTASNKHTTPRVPSASNTHTTPGVPSASDTHTTLEVASSSNPYGNSEVPNVDEETLPLPGINALRRVQLPLYEKEVPNPLSKFPPTDLLPPNEEAKEDDDDVDDDDNDDDDSTIPPTPPSVDPVLKLTRAEPSLRESSGIYFKVTDFRPGDFQPPSRVMDLSVKRVSLRRATVTLGWTSPGDDYYSGTASAIDLRFHMTTSIYTNFEKSGRPVMRPHLIRGDLVPKPGGEKHIVTIKLLGLREEDLEGRVVYFAVRAEDKVGNVGGISNVAYAYFPLAKHEKRRKQNNEGKINTVVLVVLTITIIVIGVFVMVVKKIKARRKKNILITP